MNTKWLYYSAAGTTAIAGILHLMLAPNMLNFNTNSAILFFIGGAAQLFWAVPMARRWGRVWYGIGIIGTLIFTAIWIITRVDGNPITGRAGMINEMGVAVEIMQWAFVVLASVILAIELRMKRIDKRTALDTA
jgi:peptidoglycan/LPS O-acetylase OafA/YrhL